MGYSDTQKDYKLYNIANDTFFVNRDVIFKECIFPFKHPKHTFLTSLPSPHSSIFPSPLAAFPYPAHDSFPNSTVDSSHPAIDSFPDDFSPAPPAFSDLSSPSSPTNSSPIPIPQRKSTRAIKPLIWHSDYVTSSKSAHPTSNFILYSNLKSPYRSYIITLSSLTEPSSFEQASKDSSWILAMDQEI